MKIRKYEQIMLEIEKLAKNPEENSKRLTELSNQLSKQRDDLEKIKVSVINKKLKSEKLSFNEYCNLKDILVEKKLYSKNENKINAVISGNYSEVKQKRRVVFRRFVKTVVALGLAALMGLGLYSCSNNKDKKDSKGNGTEITREVNNTPEDDNNTKKEDNSSKNKETSETKEETKKEDKKDDTKKEDKKEENTESKEGIKEQGTGNKPNDTISVTTSNGVGTETATGYATISEGKEEIIPENIIPNNNGGSLSIEPEVVIINGNTESKPNTENVIPASTGTPSLKDVEGNNEIVHEIPKDNEGEPEYSGKEEEKKDTVKEETAPTGTPSLENIEGNNEIVHEIPKDNEGEPEYSGKDEEKKDTVIEETAPTGTPSLKNVEGNDEIVHDIECNDNNQSASASDKTVKVEEEKVQNPIIVEQINEEKTENKTEVKDDTTPSLYLVDEEEGVIVYDINDNSKEINDNAGQWIELEDTFVEEISDQELPSLDNVDETEQEVEIGGVAFTLSYNRVA